MNELKVLAAKFIKQAIMTPELDEVIKDSLNIISILERDFKRLRKYREEMPDFSEVELLFKNLSDMRQILSDNSFLEFQLDLETDEPYELYDLREKATTIRNLVLGLSHKMFSTTNQIDNKRLAALANDLVYNIDRITNIMEMGKGEHAFMEKSTYSPDEINPEEIHPDAPEFQTEPEVSWGEEYGSSEHWSEPALTPKQRERNLRNRRYPFDQDYREDD